MSTAWARERPPRCSSSSTSSNDGRVAAVRVADREHPLEVAGDEVAAQQRLAGPHPVAVAPQGVDLAVVGQEAVGWASGQDGNVLVENRECTSARPLSKRGSDRSGKNSPSWCAGEHALVDEGARRQRREVHAVDLVLDALAQAERQPVERRTSSALGAGSPAAAGRRPARPGRSAAWPARAEAPRQSGSTGTSRQPRTPQALLAGQLARRDAAPGGVVVVGGQEHHPAA